MSVENFVADAVLSTRSDAIVVTDRDGVVGLWNPGAERIFGYVAVEAIGRSLDLIRAAGLELAPASEFKRSVTWVLAFAWSMDVRIQWMGKEEMFRWPFGGLMRALGGIPVHRKARANQVEQLAARFKEAERLALVVPAEGTRRWVPRWKSRFYHIARAARVPVVWASSTTGARWVASVPRSASPATCAATWIAYARSTRPCAASITSTRARSS